MPAFDRRLFERTRPVRTLLVIDVALGAVVAAMALVQAVALGHAASRAFEGAAASQIAGPLIVLAVAALVRGATSWGFQHAGYRAAHALLSQLRLELVEQRLRRRPRLEARTSQAEVATAAVEGVDALAGALGRYLPQLVLVLVVPTAVLVTVAVIDPTSAGIMLLTLPLVPVFMWLIGRRTETLARERWRALARLSGHFLDVVRGLPTLRAYNRAAYQSEQIAAVTDEYRRTTMGTLRIAFLSGAVLDLAATLGVALVAVTVGTRLVGGGLELEQGLTVLILAPELYAPIRSLAAQWHSSADGLAAATRMLDLLDDEPAAGSSFRTARAPSLADTVVRLENITMRFDGRAQPAVEAVNLRLLPGETVCLVGASGSGKTTCVSILLGLLEPTAGAVLAGTTDLASCDLESWWESIAWAPQHPTLVRGTVADNIRLGRPSTSDSEVRLAARRAGVDLFVRGLPNGYDTVVGEGGRGLSAGETRRIGLARALARSAPLLVVDEPTADLDDAAADTVAETLGTVTGGARTTLIVTHDARLAEIGDTVVTLRDGRVVEQRIAGRAG